MSIANDIRAYAESAVGQGKATLSNAQASFNDIAGKANEAVHDLRVSAERAVNVDAIRSAVEPYLAQAKDYGTTVTDRADVWIGDIKGDPRFAKLVGTAGSMSVIVRDTVQEHVFKPVQSLTGLGGGTKPATAATKPAPKPRPAAATTAPTAAPTTKSTATAPTSAAKTTPAKPAAARTTAAKTTAAKTTAAKTTAAKTTAAKTTAAKNAAAKAAADEANGKPTGDA